jgi:hypothetical protein
MPKSYKVGEEIYDIEDKDVESFLNDMPDAVEIQSFVVDKDTFDIPVSDVSDFLKDMPNAKPLKGANPVGGATSGQGSNAPTKPSTSKIASLTSKATMGDSAAIAELAALKATTERPKQSNRPNTPKVAKMTMEEEMATRTSPEAQEAYKNVYDMRREVQESPEAQKAQKKREQYEAIKPLADKYTNAKGFDEVTASISEGKPNFDSIDAEYISSLSNDNLWEQEANKIDALKAQDTPEAKLELGRIREKSLNGSLASQQARLYELNSRTNVLKYVETAGNINTQINDVLKRNQIEKDPVRKMENEAVLQRLAEKQKLLSEQYNVTQEDVTELQDIYRNIAKIDIASDYNRKVSGIEEKKGREDIYDIVKQNRTGLNKFSDALLSTFTNAAIGVGQVPKVFGDLVSDVDYDKFDEWYDNAKRSKENISATMGRESTFDNLSFWQKIPTYMGEGVGSVGSLAIGGELLGGSKVAVSAAAFLTSEGDYYQEAIEQGIDPQQAAIQASLVAGVTSAIESIVPDTEYFNPKAATRSIVAAVKNGKTVKEALKNMLKEVGPSVMEYGKRTTIGAGKEMGEEGVGQFGEDVTKTAINKVAGEELYKDTFTAKGYKESMTIGALSGGGLNFVNRAIATRRSPVQESALFDVAGNPNAINIAEEVSPDVASVRSVVEDAATVRSAWENIPSFSKLDENVQAHIVSEALRAKQLESARKEAGADESVIAKEVNEINQNILFAQNNNAIRGEEKKDVKGEEETPSPTMEWSGEEVKPAESPINQSQETENGVNVAQVGQNEVENTLIADQQAETVQPVEEVVAEESVVEAAPQEGASIELPPQVKGAMPTVMVFKDGTWQQKVGGTTTRVSEAVQQKAQEAFASVEQAPVVEQVAETPVVEEQTTETLVVETPVVEETITEQAPANELFAAIDNEIAQTDKRELAATRKANKEKFGETYKRATRITKNFNQIVERLEKEGKITKECP